MSAEELVEAVARLGGELALRGEKVHYRLPPSTPIPDAERLIAELRARKQEVLAVLRQRPAPCGSAPCGGCYVVDAETGAKIHPPRAGQSYLDWFARWNGSGKVQ
jgi:hypothetical protein